MLRYARNDEVGGLLRCARNDGSFAAMTESFFSELQLADAADGTIVPICMLRNIFISIS